MYDNEVYSSIKFIYINMSVLVSSAYTYTTLFMIMISDESGTRNAAMCRNALKARRTVIFAV